MADLFTKALFRPAFELLRDKIGSVKIFSKLIYLFFGYFDLINIYFLIIKINNFRGDLTDISANKEALDGTEEAGAGAEDGEHRIIVVHMYCIQTIVWNTYLKGLHSFLTVLLCCFFITARQRGSVHT